MCNIRYFTPSPPRAKAPAAFLVAIVSMQSSSICYFPVAPAAGRGSYSRTLRRVHAVLRSFLRQRTSMPQTIAHPVWKMIWTTTLKTGPWSNKPCMGPTSLCIKFLEPVGPGWDPVGPGWDPGGTRWTRHEDLAGLRWENMGAGAAGCTSPGPSALLSAMSCDTGGLCGNCDKHGGPESRPKYEAVKQSHVGTSRAISNHHKPPFPLKQC